MENRKGPQPLPFALLRHNVEHYGSFSRLVEYDPAIIAGYARPGAIDLLVVNLPVDASLVDWLEREWRPVLSGRAVVVFTGGPEGLSAGAYGVLQGFCGDCPVIRPLPDTSGRAGVQLTLLCGGVLSKELLALAQMAPDSALRQPLDQVFGQLTHRVLRRNPARSKGPPSSVAAHLGELTRQLQDRVMDIAILTDHYETRQTEAATALQALQSKHAAGIAALDATLADAQKKRASHWKNLEAERTALKAERRKASALRQALREEQVRVAALLSSTSWKITRPLRSLLSLTRK